MLLTTPTEMSQLATLLQVVASLSVTTAALLFARQALRDDSASKSQEQLTPTAGRQVRGSPGTEDQLAGALAELSAQWLASSGHERGSAAAADVTEDSAASLPWHSSDDEGLNALQVGGGAELPVHADASFVDAIWEAAQKPMKQAAPRGSAMAPQPSLSASIPPAGSSSQQPSTRAASTEVLPSLLLLALSAAPRRRLLREAMASVRQEMELQAALHIGAPPELGGSSSDAAWQAVAQRTVRAAVLRAGAAWIMSYDAVAAQLVQQAQGEGRQDAETSPPRDGWMALSSGTRIMRAPPSPPAAAETPSGLAAALQSAAEGATREEVLGTRAVLYAALARTLSLPYVQVDVTGRDSSALLSAAVLQDMAVSVAEAVSAAYIAWARGDTAPWQNATEDVPQEQQRRNTRFAPPPNPLAARALLLPRLRSTRPLERFRNEVALARALHWAFGSVREAFEDRQPLWGLGPEGALLRREVPVSRRAELDAMTGIRRTVSVLLEAADVVGPLLKRAGRRIGDIISWLLVTLIGRSLGLVARGVQQSVAAL